MELFSGERVVNGSVKRAYPLQSLRSASGDGPAASPGGGELGTFGPGVGPCGPDASQLVAITFSLTFMWRNTYDVRVVSGVFLRQVGNQNAVSETSLQGSGQRTWTGGVGMGGWSGDGRARAILHIEIAYEEPQRLPESDQLRYLPSKTVTTRDLHSAAPTRQTLIQVQAPPKKKPNHGKRTLELAKIMSPAYRYSPLSELVDGYADIYGVIINVTLPKKTSGRDFCMTVSVTDESCPTRAAAIQINIFYPSIAKMPKIKYVGDIIRFHKVKIQQYQDRIQGLSLHRATRHLVLREANGALEQVTNSDTWTFEPSDEQRTRKLLTWARKSLAEDDTLPQGCALAPKLLSELKFAEGFIDLVVRVLNLDDSDEPVRLTVWDGSGNAADSDRSLVRALQDKGAAVPPYGLLKEVIMSSCWPVVREMGFVEGMLTNWCRFRNLAVGVDEPIPGAAVAPGGREILRFREVTSFVLMPDFALDVKRRCSLTNRPNSSTTANDDHIRAAEENLVSPVEVATVIPDRIQKKIPVTPLCEILSSSQTPRKFHCCARVSSIWPTDIEKICKPKPGSDCEFIYSFALTVEEGSNSMNIIVYGKDAEHFLHGIPPCDLSKSTSSKTLLKKRFAALLKSPNAFHWCIKSYSVSLPLGRSADPGTAVRHRLFDTLLQCS
ncbi:hypothetical protein PC129_g22035 [Phytophthora cactorum]|uniref:Uncharacterized protein n=1 Tax=Phytophthora cactorum TaxID=29920 RepID=A0A8T1L3Q1_9STRA|nr:hypothetical protein PC120_g16681 [Phytophthora cactorum]KAG3092638.1 hypothetical protein PC122_g6501 [Phytophthora cactorum]KAG3205644.1 hypothetical protein PC129_g22035 [Phytophthora cactorum]KAG4241905.1 hypothetical protein PC116_g10192 [Phytophthora cactorum]